MNLAEGCEWFLKLSPDERQAVYKRLQGMQGPEQCLVGDVAERIPRQGAVEEAQPGKRGVGKIGGADELRGHVERELSEARWYWVAAAQEGDGLLVQYFMGQAAGLTKLLRWLDDTNSQRSDLPNA